MLCFNKTSTKQLCTLICSHLHTHFQNGISQVRKRTTESIKVNEHTEVTEQT